MSPRRPKPLNEKSVFQDEQAAGAVKLLVSVLYRAVRDYVQYNECQGDKQKFEYAVDAWDWLLDDDDNDLCSFLSICTLFNLDPGHTRCKIANLVGDSVPEEGSDLDDYIKQNRNLIEETNPEGEAEG
jgi:hypothetical protein